MANVDAPFGLRPLRQFDGNFHPRTNQLHKWTIAAAYGTKIHDGDVVKGNATTKENLERGVAASTEFMGVFSHVEYTASDGTPTFSRYWDAAGTGRTDIVAHVYDSPATIFLVQADEDIVAADFMKTADVTDTAGDDATQRSRIELDSSDVGTGANLRLLDYDRRPNNDLASDNPDVLVMINEHIMKLWS